MIAVRRGAVLLAVVLAAAGCQRLSPETPPSPDRRPGDPPRAARQGPQPTSLAHGEGVPVAESQEASASRSEGTLVVGDESTLESLLQRCRGRVVLVDFWATWCTACMEAFPHTVELHQRYAAQGLAVVSVDLDDPHADRARVLEFLQTQKAAFDNMISRHGPTPRSMEAFQIEDGVPLLRLYDRAGTLRASFGAGQRKLVPADIDAEIERLLAEPAPSP